MFNSFLIFIFTESELLKDLIWRKSFLFCWHGLSLGLIYVSVLSSGKSTVCLFHVSFRLSIENRTKVMRMTATGVVCGTCDVLNVFLMFF